MNGLNIGSMKSGVIYLILLVGLLGSICILAGLVIDARMNARLYKLERKQLRSRLRRISRNTYRKPPTR